MSVVSDAGPILSFARADRLSLLHGVAASLWIPDAVYQEIGGPILDRMPWIVRRSVSDRQRLAKLPQKLHLGEREAIILAEELDVPLLVDDREARSEAKRRGIEHFGSLRILARAKEIGLVSRVRPALDDLIAGGTYVGTELYWEFLRQVEENP
jgi:uncharacterized protein